MKKLEQSYEEKRLKALQDYAILDTLAEEEYNRFTELAALICDTPISLVSLIDENRQWFKSKVGLNINETPRDLAFCRYAILGSETLEIEDATKDERFKDNLLVIGEPNIRFYAGHPLIDPKGYALGTLCVIDRKAKILTKNQKRGLELLAKEVIALIVERRKIEELKNFEKLFQLSNDLICVAGVDGLFKKVNPSFQKVLGWTEDELLQTPFFDLCHPNDLLDVKMEIHKLISGKVGSSFSQRVRTKSGTYRSVQWVVTLEAETSNIYAIARDITEETTKEQKLKISEEKLRAFFENSQGLMCTHDLDGKFLSVNNAGAEILGYTLDEILTMSLFDITPPEKHAYLKDYLNKIAENGSASGQMKTRHKDGSLKVWYFNNVIESTFQNEQYIIGNAIDITIRHLLEKDLERTKALLEQTNKVAKVGGWEFDVDKQKVFWTAVTKEIHGVTPDFEPNLSIGVSFYKEGESRDRITEVLNIAFTKGTPWDEQLEIIDVQGKELWIRAIGNVEFIDGKCHRLFGTFQDINDYKIAELGLKASIEKQGELNTALVNQIDLVKSKDQTIEKIQEFKFLADSIPNIIWTANSLGEQDYYNSYWVDFTGMTLAESQAKGLESALHPEDLDRYIDNWKKSLNTANTFNGEYRFKRLADGMYKWFLCKAFPMMNKKEEAIKWFCSCTDIDEYKRALDLEHKINQYEDFNRIVAHNLRGPASNIPMILSMVEESSDVKEKEELLQMLKQSSVKLNDTLNELMKVLEIRNNWNLPFDECDLQAITDDVLSMLNAQVIVKKVKITTNFRQKTVSFPKLYLESIFYNMISNSIKYGNPEVISQISITSKTVNDKVVLKFEDNGLGIDLKRHRENIFKLNKIFHRGFDSKGVGLFMTKTQIETFGGKISIESEPNVGTTFTIEL